MNNYKQKAEEAWYGILIIYQETNGTRAHDEGVAYIAAALEQAYWDGCRDGAPIEFDQAYRDGVKAMREEMKNEKRNARCELRYYGRPST